MRVQILVRKLTWLYSEDNWKVCTKNCVVFKGCPCTHSSTCMCYFNYLLPYNLTHISLCQEKQTIKLTIASHNSVSVYYIVQALIRKNCLNFTDMREPAICSYLFCFLCYDYVCTIKFLHLLIFYFNLNLIQVPYQYPAV